MTKNELQRKIELIQVSDAPLEVREKKIQELKMKYSKLNNVRKKTDIEEVYEHRDLKDFIEN